MRQGFIPMIRKWFPIDTLTDQVLSDGGFSFNPKVGFVGEHLDNGYMVSLGGKESVYRSAMLGRGYIKEAIEEYLDIYEDWLQYSNHFLGAWVDESGVLYLDISEYTDKLEVALDKARERKQKAVYSIANGTTIFVNESEE